MADAPPVIIRIGSSVDASVERSFATVEQRAIKANATIQKAEQQTTTAVEKGASQKVSAEERASRRREAEASRAEKAAERAAQREINAANKASDAKAKAANRAAAAQEKATNKAANSAMRGFAQIGQAAEKAANASLRGFAQIAQAARAAENAQARASQRANTQLGTRFARGVANTSSRFLAPYAPIASFARRSAGELARGLGVDLNIGSSVSRNVERETLATALSNSGFQEKGTGPNATRVSGSTLQKEATAVGLQNAIDPTSVLSAGRAFVGVTGNLDQSRQMMGDLAKISKATTSDMTDVSRAAAKINAQMADTPTKAQDTLAVIRLLAGQGKLGAAEMSDYAKSIGQIAGASHRFHGDTATNIAELSAMAQLSQQKGFSKGSAQAATGITSFANVFSNSANVKTFAKTFGVTPAAMEKRLQGMSPEQIIKASLQQTAGDPLKMGALFKNQRARSMTLPFEQAFNEASGGKKDAKSVAAGTAAVDAAFAKLKEGAMSAGEVDKEFAAQMQTTASKAQQFQIKLDDVVQTVQAKLLPSLEKLEPYFLQAADGLAKLVGWIAENPGSAIATAITLSMGRAGLEQVLRTGLERAMLGSGGQNANLLGKIMGNLGAGFVIASLAITTATIGMALIDHWGAKKTDAQKAGVGGLAGADAANNTAEALLKQGDVKGAKAAADAAVEKAKAGEQGVEGSRGSGGLQNVIRAASGLLPGGQLIEAVFDKKIGEVLRSNESGQNKTQEMLLIEQQRANSILNRIANTIALQPPAAPPGPAGPPPGRTTQL